jgi:CheY-like chemotaxis protein
VTDVEAFKRLVHDAYAHLYDRAFLRTHPLASLLTEGGSGRAERLHARLVEAVEWLRPFGAEGSSLEWRRYRSVRMRCVDGATAEQVAQTLSVSPRQARRDGHDGIDEIALTLHAAIEPAASAPAGSVPGVAELDDELSVVASATRPIETDLDEVIQGAVATVARLAVERGVAIEVNGPTGVPPLRVGRALLRQLLTTALAELIVAGSSRTLAIMASHADEFVLIEVRSWPDIALGAPSADLVARIAEGLGGTASLSAAGLRIRVPLADRVLLLVDDNPDLALLFRHYLADAGLRIVHARSAEQAERLAIELTPDLIVLDLILPDQDGWELLSALRARERTRAVPIAVCSVLPDQALARSLGVDDFLAKPVTRESLRRLVGRLAPLRARFHPTPDEPSERAPQRRTPARG